MGKVLFAILVFVLSSLFINAQKRTDPIPKADSAIKVTVVPQGKYSSILYTIDGKPLTQSGLERCLMSYNASALELEKYKSVKRDSRITALIFIAVSMGAIIAGGIQVDQHKESNASNFSKSPVFFSIGIAGLIGEVVCLGRKNEHFGKAIEMYNNRF